MNGPPHYAAPPAHHGYIDAHHGPPPSGSPAYGHYQNVPMLPPAVGSYSHGGYYPYASPTGPPPSHFSQPMSLSSMPSGGPPALPPPAYHEPSRQMDTTGQVAPPGNKCKLTAILWEDEGAVCFQVEIDGICVARRSDNHMINGTKLLNVARMTRGRRDGILKSEKHRKVIKIGPMHLKGVWIPYDRALEFANKEKITEQLYPLFVHDIDQHIHQPAQIGPAGATLSHRRTTSQYSRASSSHTPALSQSLQSPVSLGTIAERPGLDRSHTFPTPPTSANAASMHSVGGSYDWNHSLPPAHPAPVETALGTVKSMPNTPATTPPENLQMHYPVGHQAGYEAKAVYSAPPNHHQSPYTMPHGGHYGYARSDMPPPLRTNYAPDYVTKREEDTKSSTSVASDGRAYTFQGQQSAHLPDQSPVEAAEDDGRRSPTSGGQATPRAMGDYKAPQHMPGDSRGAPMALNGYAMSAPHAPQSYYVPDASRKRMREQDDDESYAREKVHKRQKSSVNGLNPHRPIATPRSHNRVQSVIMKD